MSAEEAVRRLDALRSGDPETAHGEADQLLLEVLRANGFSDVAEAWERAADRVAFWYA